MIKKFNNKKACVLAGFQHADFSAFSADFYKCADFSAYPHRNFHHNADCQIKRFLFCKDLDKNKIANTSSIKFSLMAGKTSLFLLNKINYFYLHWFIAKKAYEATKEKKDVISNWSHLNLRRHNFDFHLCNTVVAVDLFVALAVAVAAAAAVVVPVVVAVGKNVQQ